MRRCSILVTLILVCLTINLSFSPDEYLSKRALAQKSKSTGQAVQKSKSAGQAVQKELPLRIQRIYLTGNKVCITVLRMGGGKIEPANYSKIKVKVVAGSGKLLRHWSLSDVDRKKALVGAAGRVEFDTGIVLKERETVKAILSYGKWETSKQNVLLPIQSLARTKKMAPTIKGPVLSVEKIFLKDDGNVWVVVKNIGKANLSPADSAKKSLYLNLGTEHHVLRLRSLGLNKNLAPGKSIPLDTGKQLKVVAQVSASLSQLPGDKVKTALLKPPSMGYAQKPKAPTSKNAKEPKAMSSSNMLKDRVAASQVSEQPGPLTAPNRAAGKHIDLTPENRVIGGPLAGAESLTELAKADKTPRLVSGQMAKAPRRTRDAVGVQRAAEEGIIVERPLPGTQVHAGNEVTIRWEYVESVFEEYRGGVMSVDLYVRSVADPTNMVWFYTAGSEREVTWYTPSETPPGTYTIHARFDSGSGLYTGSSHIEVLASSDLVLLWPPESNPSETILYVGYRYPIRWNAYGEADGRSYNIELMDGGRSFDVIASSVNPPSMRLDWVVGGDCGRSSTVPNGDNFRVRLSTADAPVFEALSAPFTIRLPTIAVDVRPRAGDRWRIGSSQLIAWNTDHVPEGSRVTLRLLKGGRNYLLIEENQLNTGSFVWEEAGIEKYTGPITSGSISRREASPGNDYSIQVEMESCPLVYGISPVFELYE